MLLLTLVFAFCFLIAAAYMAFGVLHMVVPAWTLPVYRYFLGPRRFAKAEPQFLLLAKSSWKLLGAAFIVLGLVFTYALVRSLAHVLSR